jgi:hypothetical protein
MMPSLAIFDVSLQPSIHPKGNQNTKIPPIAAVQNKIKFSESWNNPERLKINAHKKKKKRQKGP